MADQRITQLNQLNEADVAATDVLPIVDISATETKKVTAKDLFEAGATLADNSSINLGKLDQSSATKLGTTALADDAVTYDKLQNVSSTDRVLGRSSAGAGNVEEITLTSAGRALIDDADASEQRTTLGLGTIATQDADNVAITGGTISNTTLSGITDLAIADGGTGASTAAGARTNLGLVIGTDVQAQDAGLQSIAGLTTSADQTIYTTGADTYAVTSISSYGRSLIDDADASAARTTLGLGSLATQSGTFSGTHSGTSSGTNTGDQTITLTGDVTGSGTGSFATTIANDAVTTGKIINSAVTTGKINDAAVTGAKLAADSATVISGNTPAGNGAFQGQQWLNTNTGLTYVWTGSAWQQVAALQSVSFSDSTPLSFSVTKPDNFSTTITTSLDTQTAATVFAGPTSGAAAAPTFRSLASTDLPVATASTNGVVQPGTGLSVTGGGVLNHTNTASTGTYTKVTIDAQGHVSSGTTLSAGDIPNLDVSKITTGTFGSSLISNDAITGIKLADSSTVQFGGSGSTAGVVTFPHAEFKGQYFFDELNGDLYIWTGSAWLPVTITSGELVYGGTYDASINRVGSVTSAGSAVGLTAGAILPAASSTNNRYYVVVSDSGNGSGNAPNEPLAPPDMILSNGATWDLIDVSNAIAGQTASNISFTPYGGIIATNVQTALQEIDDEKLAKAGGTVTGALEIGTTGSLVFEGSTADAYETTLTVVDPTADRTISLPNSTGTLITTGDTGVITSTMITDGTIVNGDISASAAIDYSKLAALSAGRLIVGNASNVPTAVDVTGDVTIDSSGVTAIGSGVIVNADINASAAIDDSKLGTISTADKVSLSALNIDGGTDIGGDLADADLIIVDDGGGGTNRKAAVTRISDYTFGKVTGDIAIASNGTASISSGVIVDADINASAEIAVSKLADGTARQLLQTDAAGTGVEWTSNVDIPGTLDVTGAATFDGAVTIQGDLTVNGTTTNINTQNLVVEDKNVIIGDVATPTDVTADGGGVTLKGATDKTFNWVNATDAWTSSENIDVALGKDYKIAGTTVLSAGTLGSTISSSSLTSVSTLTSGTWNANTIGVAYGGTGQTTYTNGQLLIGNTTGNTLTKSTLTAGSGISITNGSGSITIAATGAGGTVTNVTGTAPISVANGTTTPAISISAASTSASGAVQLTDSVSSTSTSTAATPNSVKTAYDLANAALPKSGGTLTGSVTFASGQVYPQIPANSKTSAYTLVVGDAGKHISITTGGVTVPASVFSTGDAVTIFNNSTSNQTITQGASVTLRFAGTTNTGNRTLAAYGIATILCVASNTFVISGGGLS